MLERFKKWISCVTCVKATMTGLKASLLVIGPLIIEHGPTFGLLAETGAKYVGLATSIVGGVLLLLERLPASVVKDAKDLSGVQVHVNTEDPNTPSSVVKLAEGPTEDVFPMIGGPRYPSDHLETSGAHPEADPEPSPPDNGGYKTLKG